MRFADLVKGIRPLESKVSIRIDTDDVKGRFTLPDTFLTTLTPGKVLEVVARKSEVTFRGSDKEQAGVNMPSKFSGKDTQTILRRYYGKDTGETGEDASESSGTNRVKEALAGNGKSEKEAVK